MKKKFLLLASVVIIIILFIIKLNAWYSKNNLKFISEDMKEQIIEWLNIDKKYSNSLELIRIFTHSYTVKRRVLNK